MNNINNVIIKKINNYKLNESYILFLLRKNWFHIIGEKNSTHSSPEKIIKNYLFVNVDSSTWANEFYFLKEEILEKIHIVLKKNIVKKIFFKVGMIKQLDSTEKKNKFKVIIDNFEISVKETLKINNFLNKLCNKDIQKKAENILKIGIKLNSIKKVLGWYKCLKCDSLIQKGEYCFICSSKH